MNNVSVDFLERLRDFCDAVSEEDTYLHGTAKRLSDEIEDILEEEND